ncbi:MAG: hypothetical protein ABIE22_03825, partial [archaeon]
MKINKLLAASAVLVILLVFGYFLLPSKGIRSNVIQESPPGITGLDIGIGALDISTPQIFFTLPTHPDNFVSNLRSAEINTTMELESLNTMNWSLSQSGENTDFSFYDDSLVLYMNLDNNAEIGETSTLAVDNSKYSNNGIFISSGNPPWTPS